MEGVGAGGRHGHARDDVAHGRMDHFRQREGRREGTAAALDDDQETAVADRGEVGQFGQGGAVDVGGQRPCHRIATFAGADDVDDGGTVQVDTEGVAGHRRSGQGGEGCGCARGRGTPRTDRRTLRREARTDRGAGRAGDDEARAFGRGGESAGTGADSLCQGLGDLGQGIDDHVADAAKRLRHTDSDGEVCGGGSGTPPQAHRPDVIRHRRTGQVEHERRRHGRCDEGSRRLDRQRRGEGPGRLPGNHQARALRRRGVIGKAGVAADGGGQRFGDLFQGVRAGADGDLALDRLDHDLPFVACLDRSGQVDHVGLDRAGRSHGQGRIRRTGRGYRHCRHDGAGRALDDQQGIALDHGGKFRTEVGNDPCRKPGGELGLRVVGRIDRQGCGLGTDRQRPFLANDQGPVDREFARGRDAAELDLAGRRRGSVDGGKIADRE